VAKITVSFNGKYDLERSLGVLRQGSGDPAIRLSRAGVVRATRTPAGPAVMDCVQTGEREVVVEAAGPGAEWLLENAPSILGAGDDPSQLVPHHGVVRTLHSMFSGMRILNTGAVFESLVVAVIGQKVISADAKQSYRRLVKRYGERAPGDADLFVPPSAQTLAEMTYADYHRCGLERRRAETIRYAAKRAGRIDECAQLPVAAAKERLLSLPGIGPWTVAEVAIVALGDADAVSVGDYHLPNTVCWALAGEPRGDDARMLELLELYAGQRGRVAAYLVAGGVRAPRRGPRLERRDIARM
jgi:3-methyladenine DNA glycosylase/8-oxoguanine DNA glycosylase